MRAQRSLAVLIAAIALVLGCSQSSPEEGGTPLRGGELRAKLWELAQDLSAAASAKADYSYRLPSDEGISLQAFLDLVEPERLRYQAALDRARAALDEYESLLGQARDGGYLDEFRLDPAIAGELATEWRFWLDSEDLQNSGDFMCFDLLSDSDLAKPFSTVVVESPSWSACFLGKLNDPLIQRGSFDAAIRLQELAPIVQRAWG